MHLRCFSTLGSLGNRRVPFLWQCRNNISSWIVLISSNESSRHCYTAWFLKDDRTMIMKWRSTRKGAYLFQRILIGGTRESQKRNMGRSPRMRTTSRLQDPLQDLKALRTSMTLIFLQLVLMWTGIRKKQRLTVLSKIRSILWSDLRRWRLIRLRIQNRWSILDKLVTTLLAQLNLLSVTCERPDSGRKSGRRLSRLSERHLPSRWLLGKTLLNAILLWNKILTN